MTLSHTTVNRPPLEEQVKMVCAFVAANPKERGRSADMLVQLAMQSKWPCKQHYPSASRRILDRL